MKYWIAVDDENVDIEEVSSDFISNHFNISINEKVNKELMNQTNGFVQYMNNPGILDIRFTVYNGKLLETVVVMNHKLSKEEFDTLYTDITSQLMAGLGKKFGNISLCEFNDTVEYSKDGVSECKPAVKNIFCQLWQYDDWALKFTKDCRNH